MTSHDDNSADTSETKQARIERDVYRRDIWIIRLSDNPVIFIVREPGPKNECFVHPLPQKRFDSGLLLFDNS